jgi:hypothetical protein
MAMHIADTGALSMDVAYQLGQVACEALRTMTINTTQAYSKPSRTAQQNNPPVTVKLSHVARKLYDNRLDFTVADNVFMKEAWVENGRLTNGKISFSAVALTSVEVIPTDVLEKLIFFKKNGGTVVFMGALPTLSDRHDGHDEVKRLVSGLVAVSEDEGVKALIDSVDYGIEISDRDGIMVGKYDLDGATAYWLVNTGDTATVSISKRGASGFDIYEPTSEIITSATGESISVELKGHSGLILVSKM